MRDLTARQQQILSLIQQHIADTGFPPTRAEIATKLGFRSPNAAEEHLKALARKGMIELTSGASRGIRLRRLPDSELEVPRAVQVALSLPLVGRVAAGSPILAQEHVEASYAVDPALFDTRPDYLLRVRGMSMRDAGILEDDLLAVKKISGLSQLRNGQIVVARLHDEVTVKRFQHQGREIHLLPENPAFKPIVVPDSDPDLAIEGLGIGVIRNPRVLS